jgi:hypothetical protein
VREKQPAKKSHEDNEILVRNIRTHIGRRQRRPIFAMPMKTPENDPLSQLLGQWKIAEPVPPRFQEEVWRRIGRASAAVTPTAWELGRRWLEKLFASKAVALAYVTVLLGLGLAAGYVNGRTHQQRSNAELAARYVQSLDPWHPDPY